MGDCKKIAGIILAAGQSLRMGKTKQLLDFRGKPLLQWAVDAALGAQLDKVGLVLGHEHHKILAALDCSQITVVCNPDYRQGQSTSLKSGLKQIHAEYDGAIFMLGDQPLVDAAILNQLITAFQKSHAPIITPTFQGQTGNPVLMNRTLFAQLQDLSGDVGGRSLKQTYAEKTVRVPVSHAGILIDFNTPADYNQTLNLTDY